MAPEQRKQAAKELRKQDAEALATLREWWLQQMIHPASAAVERATLFWHGHFATSIQKVKSTALMAQQNQLFRRFAFGNFRDLVKAISRDPAIIIWLDLQQSRAGAPNENFARELMELFTLGIGHYSEADIKAAARAFTGYRARPWEGHFHYARRQHDDGEKTFMGKTGRFSGDDIIDIICEQPACATFLCEKLWTFYAYEDPEPEIVAALAETLRNSHYELRPVLVEMFSSAAFYSERARATQIQSPAQLIARTCRTLQCPPPPAFLLQRTMRSLGQLLFAPPNVKGWEGNRSWINTATLTARVEFTDLLLGFGERPRFFADAVPLEKLVPDAMLNDSAKLVDGLTSRLLAIDATPYSRAELITEAEKFPKPLSRSAVREMLAKVMRLPEFQLV
jgi:uncharacterized protein (DUF1800 family)